MSFNDEIVKDKTYVGYINDFWDNQNKIRDIVKADQSFDNLNGFFDKIKSIIKDSK